MTPEEKAELVVLCERIVAEKDPYAFHALIIELQDLLERKGHQERKEPVLPICPVCGKPCPLEDCVVNAKGTAIHKDCYRASRMSEDLL
jgi:hypothetical protein